LRDALDRIFGIAENRCRAACGNFGLCQQHALMQGVEFGGVVGAFWAASGVPAGVLLTIGGIAATIWPI
jgi:hypothetical protein